MKQGTFWNLKPTKRNYLERFSTFYLSIYVYLGNYPCNNFILDLDSIIAKKNTDLRSSALKYISDNGNKIINLYKDKFNGTKTKGKEEIELIFNDQEYIDIFQLNRKLKKSK